jgi:type IV secretory pathway VirD2 relaxase
VNRAKKEPAKRLDWNTKKFELWWSYKDGTAKATTTNNKPTSDNMGKTWTVNWHISKDGKSAVSKLSSTGESIETMHSQLTHQQQENKKLTELTKKLKDESSKAAVCHEQQILERDQQWKTHMDIETASFLTHGTGKNQVQSDNQPDDPNIQGNEQLIVL